MADDSFFFFLFPCEFGEGVAVGCGWQKFVAYVNVGCYYGVGVPLGTLLAFRFKLGAKVCNSVQIYHSTSLVGINKILEKGKCLVFSTFACREYGLDCQEEWPCRLLS